MDDRFTDTRSEKIDQPYFIFRPFHPSSLIHRPLPLKRYSRKQHKSHGNKTGDDHVDAESLQPLRDITVFELLADGRTILAAGYIIESIRRSEPLKFSLLTVLLFPCAVGLLQ